MPAIQKAPSKFRSWLAYHWAEALFISICALIVIVLIILCGIFSDLVYGQERRQPMPPDLLLVSQINCTLFEHQIGTSLDAKTGKETAIMRYRVEPEIKYVNPDHHAAWHLPEEDFVNSQGETVKRNGALADKEEESDALAVCKAWRLAVKDATTKEFARYNKPPKGESKQ